MKAFVKQLVARYLALWARFVLIERRPLIIGVTGSVGKTTTKEVIYHVLADPQVTAVVGRVGKASGNLNTEIGLPLAVLRYDQAPQSIGGWLWLFVSLPFRTFGFATMLAYPSLLVLEYAADRVGDIKRLVQLAPPRIGVVTAVGPAHLERFGTVAQVAHEKAALIRCLPPNGLALLARDNSWVYAMERETHAPVKFIAGRGLTLASRIALEIAKFFHISPEIVQEALTTLPPMAGRLHRARIGSTLLIDDTYNANPLSMELAIDSLVEAARPGQRRVALLGQMNELGAASAYYHEQIGQYARERVDLSIGVGPAAKAYQFSVWYPTSNHLAQVIDQWLKPGDAILMKGSRGVRMEQVVAALRTVLTRSSANKNSERRLDGNRDS